MACGGCRRNRPSVNTGVDPSPKKNVVVDSGQKKDADKQSNGSSELEKMTYVPK